MPAHRSQWLYVNLWPLQYSTLTPGRSPGSDTPTRTCWLLGGTPTPRTWGSGPYTRTCLRTTSSRYSQSRWERAECDDDDDDDDDDNGYKGGGQRSLRMPGEHFPSDESSGDPQCGRYWNNNSQDRIFSSHCRGWAGYHWEYRQHHEGSGTGGQAEVCGDGAVTGPQGESLSRLSPPLTRFFMA